MYNHNKTMVHEACAISKERYDYVNSIGRKIFEGTVNKLQEKSESIERVEEIISDADLSMRETSILIILIFTNIVSIPLNINNKEIKNIISGIKGKPFSVIDTKSSNELEDRPEIQ